MSAYSMRQAADHVHDTLVSGRCRYLRSMDSQPAILCNSHMNARSALTRRRSLQVLATSLLAPFAAALRSGATAQTPAAITQRRPESRSTTMIKHVKFAEIAGGPHGLCWTHADRVNAELVPFVE